MSNLRPDICPSRSSLDSGFESGKSKTSSGPSSPHSSRISEVSTKCKTAKRPKLDIPSPLSTVTTDNIQNQPEDLATKLINSCTSPKSTANVRRLLLYCTPSTSNVPSHKKRSELKDFIFEKFGEKKTDQEDEKEKTPEPPQGTYGEYECSWGACEKRFESENHVYDHLMEEHFAKVRSNPSEKPLACCWDECELSVARGDFMKKVSIKGLSSIFVFL